MKTLAQRLTWAREQKALTQEALAKLSGVSQSTIGNLESGLRLKARNILEIAQALGVDAMWLANGQGGPAATPTKDLPEEDDGFVVSAADASAAGQRVRPGDPGETIPIRAVKIKIQAGSDGYVAEPDFDIDGGYFHVPADVIATLRVDPSDLIVTTFRGRSMEPMYFDGDKGLVDTSKRKPVDNECFVVNWNGEMLVKCLIKKSDGWCLNSFNRDYPSISVRSGHCSIIGMVVWQPARIVKGLL